MYSISPIGFSESLIFAVKQLLSFLDDQTFGILIMLNLVLGFTLYWGSCGPCCCDFFHVEAVEITRWASTQATKTASCYYF